METQYLSKIKIRGFRNLERVDLELSEGINIFWGDNAQGKSNALEAIHFMATATSPRTTRTTELITKGGDTVFVEGVVERENAPEVLSIGLDEKTKLIRSNGARLQKVSELYGRFPVVSMAPEDMQFVNGSPRERRRLIDIALGQMNPSHVVALQQYNRVLRHRNALLRRGHWNQEEMDTWEEKLAGLGAVIMLARREIALCLAERISVIYKELLEGKELLDLRYQPSLSNPPEDEAALREALLERVQGQRDTDRERCMTHTGPHRDNYELRVQERDLKIYGSQGQRRTAVLALRLAEMEEMNQRNGCPPLLLADDVIYEMDPGRRASFLARLKGRGQCILTATHPEHLGELASEGRRFFVKEGSITHESR
jgi:DNA replication and repair protein RecF